MPTQDFAHIGERAVGLCGGRVPVGLVGLVAIIDLEIVALVNAPRDPIPRVLLPILQLLEPESGSEPSNPGLSARNTLKY